MEVIEIPQIKDGDTLKQMFDGQRALLGYYITLEDLPMYPIDINAKDNQALLKKFMNRIIGELSEAYEEIYLAWKCASENEGRKAKQHVMKYNEELADAWHFMLEVMLYVGMDEDELEAIFFKKTEEEPGTFNALYEPDKTLRSYLKLAAFANYNDGNSIRNMQGFIIHDQPDLIKYPEFAGGNKVSENILEVHAQFLWAITHGFNKTANNLKNKEWAQSTHQVNELLFRENLLNSFMVFLKYMDYIGKTETSIHNSYFLKNHINRKRIKDGY